MASKQQFRHQDIAVPAAGTKVRTIHAGKHKLRIAFPKGARKRGSGQLVSILHPLSEKNPACGASLTVAEVSALQIPLAATDEFGPEFEGLLDSEEAGQNPIDWKAKWDALRAKVAGFIAPHRGGAEAQSNPSKLKEYEGKWHLMFGKGGSGTIAVKAATSKEAKKKIEGLLRVNEKGDFVLKSVKLTPQSKSTPVTAYSVVRGADFQQEWYETKSRDAGKRASQLRKLGFKVSVSGMGSQVTPVGTVNMTLLSVIHPGDREIPPPERVERLNPAPPQEIMGSKYTLSTSYKDRQNVSYELYKQFPGLEGKGVIIVRDLDANQVIHALTYPTFKKARYEYQRTVRIARKNPKRAKRNLDELDQAARLTGQFRGSPADKVTEVDEPAKRRDDFAHLGWLNQLVFHPAFDHAELDLEAISSEYDDEYNRTGDSVKSWKAVASAFGIVLLVFDFEGDEIRLVSSADGKQLYFLGGNQKSFERQLELFKTPTDHDFVDLGDVVSATYNAKKAQAGDTEERGYYHIFGEEGGTAPRGSFDMLNKRLRLSGGTYHLNEAERGIIN